jgi:hypothetical protein
MKLLSSVTAWALALAILSGAVGVIVYVAQYVMAVVGATAP